MHSKNKIRIACIFLSSIIIGGWGYLTNGLYQDYVDLLNSAPVVRLSILTLWFPLGCFGGVLTMLWSLPKALIYGKKFDEMYVPKGIDTINKLCLAFALIGVAFAIGWSFHSINLLERKGYVYSSALTNITPTGIHLRYIHVR